MITETTLLERTLDEMARLERRRMVRKSTTVLVHQVGELYFICDALHDPTGKEGYVVSKSVLERDYEEL
jgi:hypothetical protein